MSADFPFGINEPEIDNDLKRSPDDIEKDRGTKADN